MARDTVEGYPPTLGLMDIVARRNAFGRQVASFEADLAVKGVAGAPVRAVFIRAPWIESAGPAVEVLAEHAGHAVAARQGRVLVTAFHPELTDDARLHELFVAMIRRRHGAAGTRRRRTGPPRRPPRAAGGHPQPLEKGVLVSGHSKWATIKHKKGKDDAKRGKLFSKLSRAITVAAREGGADPAMNIALANAVEKAKSHSMPKDNIERAIQRGAGGGRAATQYEAIVYEGYGPAGVAIIVEVLTDNRNRSAAEVRNIFTKHGGSLAQPGAVAWMFERRGSIVVDAGQVRRGRRHGGRHRGRRRRRRPGRRPVRGPHPARRPGRGARRARGRRHRLRVRPS